MPLCHVCRWRVRWGAVYCARCGRRLVYPRGPALLIAGLAMFTFVLAWLALSWSI